MASVNKIRVFRIRLGTWIYVLAFQSMIVAALGGDFMYRKQVLSTAYFSEGASAGDFNKDGHQDIVSGPFWYEGPELLLKHEYNNVKVLDAAGKEYTSNFFQWPEDVNADGWLDIIIVGLPGTSAYWYQNPGETSVNKSIVHWKENLIAQQVGNESPVLFDINGDGRRDLVYNSSDGYFRWAEVSVANPSGLWKIHTLSTKGDQFRYTHGLGFGDINGDGRPDLIECNGWWEKPAKLEGDPLWKFHAYTFNDGGAQMYSYDVDGDGDSDVVSTMDAHGFGLAWFEQLNGSSGITFKKHMIMGTREEVSIYGVAFSQLHALAIVDIDGDGLLDLVTGKRKWAHGPDGDVEPNNAFVLYAFQLQRMKDSVKFIPQLLDSNSGAGCDLAISDIDGDGLKDIVTGNKNGTFVFFKQAPPTSVYKKSQSVDNLLFNWRVWHNGYDILGRTVPRDQIEMETGD